jgi:APA family basic amino acid/polyamine antiporter
LVYYAIANAAAVTLPAQQRRWPRGLHLLGIVGCAVLIVTLPIAALIAGIAELVIGVIVRLVMRGPGRLRVFG